MVSSLAFARALVLLPFLAVQHGLAGHPLPEPAYLAEDILARTSGKEPNTFTHMFPNTLYDAAAPLPTSFRLGSGAVGNGPRPVEGQPVEDDSLKPAGAWRSAKQHLQNGRLNPLYPTKSQEQVMPAIALPMRRMKVMTLVAVVLLMMLPVVSMMQGGGGGPVLVGGARDFNYRIPPAWNPENESNYSFRAYMTDISIWLC